MRAFHGQEALKTMYLERLRQHRMAGEIIQGFGWYNGRGGAISCTIHGDRCSDYERELGIPAPLASLQDKIFQKLDEETAPEFPERFLGAIRPDAELSGIWSKFAAWLLCDPAEGVIQYSIAGNSNPLLFAAVHASILQVAEICRESSATIETWKKAKLEAAGAKAAAVEAMQSTEWKETRDYWATAAALNAADVALSVANCMVAIQNGTTFINTSSHAEEWSSAAAGWAEKASASAGNVAHCRAAVVSSSTPEVAAARAYVQQSKHLLELLQTA